MTAPCALSTAADATPLCCVCFSEVAVVHSTLGSGAGDRATRTPHSTPHVRTAQRAPVSSIDTFRMTTVEHTAYIHTKQQQQQQQQHIFFKPHLIDILVFKPEAVDILVFSIFGIFVAVFDRCHNLERKFDICSSAPRKDVILEQ